jgi:hypothetical protein
MTAMQLVEQKPWAELRRLYQVDPLVYSGVHLYVDFILRSANQTNDLCVLHGEPPSTFWIHSKDKVLLECLSPLEYRHFRVMSEQVVIEGLVQGVTYGILNQAPYPPYIFQGLNPEFLGYFPDGSWEYRHPKASAPVHLEREQVLVFDFGKSLLEGPDGPLQVSETGDHVLDHLKLPRDFVNPEAFSEGISEELFQKKYPEFWAVISHYRGVLRIGLELICRYYLRMKGVEGEFTVSVPPVPSECIFCSMRNTWCYKRKSTRCFLPPKASSFKEQR